MSRGRSALAVVGAALAVVVSLDVAAAAGWRPHESDRSAQTLRTTTPNEPATTTTVSATTTTVASPTTTTIPATTTTVTKRVVIPAATHSASTSSAVFAHVYVINRFSGAITFAVNGSGTIHIAKGATAGPINVKPDLTFPRFPGHRV